MKGTTLVTLAALACASAPFALQAASEKVDARQELDRLGVPLGDMTCTGQTLATAKRSGYPTRARLHVEKDLDGYWLAFHYDEEKTTENANPYHVVQYIGFNEKSKRFDSVTMDDTGTGPTLGTSAGWDASGMTVEEKIPSGAYRDVFTKTADSVSHSGMLLGKDKKWVKTDEETCRRSAQ